jgi:hypothetical protein
VTWRLLGVTTHMIVDERLPAWPRGRPDHRRQADIRRGHRPRERRDHRVAAGKKLVEMKVTKFEIQCIYTNDLDHGPYISQIAAHR